MNLYRKLAITLVCVTLSVNALATEKNTWKTNPHKYAQYVTDVLDTIDPVKTSELYTEDSLFVYGNSPAITGKKAIFEAQTSFFSSIKVMKHTIKRVWTGSDTLVAEMTVTYTRHDNSTISLPVTDILTIKNGKISESRIYMDIAPLFNPKP